MTGNDTPSTAIVATPLLRGRYDCIDCGLNTSHADEYYMLKDDIWSSTWGGRDMLCIGCVENRIGRRLEPSDFIDCPLNFGPYMSDGSPRRKSPRLAARMGSISPTSSNLPNPSTT